MFRVQKCLLSNFLRKQPRPPSFRYQFIYPIYIYLPESLALPRIVIHSNDHFHENSPGLKTRDI